MNLSNIDGKPIKKTMNMENVLEDNFKKTSVKENIEPKMKGLRRSFFENENKYNISEGFEDLLPLTQRQRRS